MDGTKDNEWMRPGSLGKGKRWGDASNEENAHYTVVVHGREKLVARRGKNMGCYVSRENIQGRPEGECTIGTRARNPGRPKGLGPKVPKNRF